MGSFNYLNYYLRPNKNVERKLIFDTLNQLKKFFNLSEYRYFGLGSMWFIDFIHAHKVLSINDMISIEEKQYYIPRKEFNKPYKCIDVEPGETTQVIPDLSFGDKKSLVWFDYDSHIDGPILLDIPEIIARVQKGSIFIITINADNYRLRELADSKEKKDQFDIFKSVVSEAIPVDASENWLTKKKYPELLSKTIINKLQDAPINAGRDESFYPIFNFYYKDTSPMLTIGGMLVDEFQKSDLEGSEIFDRSFITKEELYEIDIPPLTMKEKKAIDQLLPNNSLTVDEIENEFDFRLKKSHVDAYREFYKYYPLYGELQV